jgi:hypothetical protein
MARRPPSCTTQATNLIRMVQLCPSPSLDSASQQQTPPPSLIPRCCMMTTSATTTSTTPATTLDQPLRRRRRRNTHDSSTTTSTTNAAGTELPSNGEGGGAFAPKDSNGNLLNAQEYLKLASLSPWVPCPDIVIKRVLEIANANNSDIHGDLGCGDGRLNFAAISGPFHVSKSWGVDVDKNILEKCHERLGKRFVPRTGDASIIGSRTENSEAERLEFHQADLIRVIERQKQKYHSQQTQQHEAITPSLSDAPSQGEGEDWSNEDAISHKISTSTIITMYFVNDALKQIKPYLESTLGGNPNVRVITIGYEMHGWDATWVERVLGLTIFKYDMCNISNVPFEWRVGESDDNDGSAAEGRSQPTLPNDHQDDIDGDTELSQFYLKQKRAQDIEDLNAGLRIHHDEKLNEFAQARSSSRKTATQHETVGAATITEEWENVDEGWDFDETEDPEELMREAHKTMMKNARHLRGKGMMAGLDREIKQQQRQEEGKEDRRPTPIWKKP